MPAPMALRPLYYAVLSCSVVSDSATLWTVARQSPLSMGNLQARTLEWVAMPFSRGSSQPRDRTQVSCIAGGHVPTATLILINLNIHICIVIPYWIVHI